MLMYAQRRLASRAICLVAFVALGYTLAGLLAGIVHSCGGDDRDTAHGYATRAQ